MSCFFDKIAFGEALDGVFLFETAQDEALDVILVLLTCSLGKLSSKLL